MSKQRFCNLAVGVLTLLLGTHDAFAKTAKPNGTINDLAGKEIEVLPEAPANVQSRKAADEYRHFLERKGGDSTLRVEAMRRLGDLDVETDEALRGDVDPSTMTVAELHEAIKLYENLLTVYPQYPRIDAVMYQLARAYEANGQPEKALAMLTRLVTEHPNSRWVAEAHFRRGEILFSRAR